MSTEIIQVRDIPAEDARALRSRASARNMSLSSYLRELIHDDVSRPTMADMSERTGGRDRIDTEVTSAVRGLMMTSKPASMVDGARAEEMLDVFADLPLARHRMQPYQRRVLGLRNNFTAYDAFYVALAESLREPVLTDDRTYARPPGHSAVIEAWA